MGKIIEKAKEIFADKKSSKENDRKMIEELQAIKSNLDDAVEEITNSGTEDEN